MSTRLARIGYITGSIVSILTGAVHTSVHYALMSGSEVQAHMDAFGPLTAMGPDIMLFNLWQGLSYLMGFFAAALGATNLAALYSLGKGAHPSKGVALVNMVMMVGVCWSGIMYLSEFQAIGGPAGIVLFGLTLLPKRDTLT